MQEEEKNKGGRPRAEIDLKQLELLARSQCTDEEIAAWFGIERTTIHRRKKDDPEFLAAMDRGKLKGCASLRSAQMKAALEGNSTLLIWMGKQLLGQSDKSTFSGDLTVKKRLHDEDRAILESLGVVIQDDTAIEG